MPDLIEDSTIKLTGDVMSTIPQTGSISKLHSEALASLSASQRNQHPDDVWYDNVNRIAVFCLFIILFIVEMLLTSMERYYNVYSKRL